VDTAHVQAVASGREYENTTSVAVSAWRTGAFAALRTETVARIAIVTDLIVISP
jgi:hypothetical protein